MKTTTTLLLAGLTTLNFGLGTFNSFAQCNIALNKQATASSVWAPYTTDKAFDGKTSTNWNAGGGLPKWIKVNLDSNYSISNINLLVNQAPAGNTIHYIYISSDMVNFTRADTISGYTSAGQWLNRTYNPPLDSVRGIKIETVTSPSWVSWAEIEILAASTSASVNLGSDTVLCSGDSLLLTPGNNFSSYLWQNSTTSDTLKITGAGTYWVKVSDTLGCKGVDTIVVAESTYPQVELGNDTILCLGQLLDAKNTGATYLWQDNSTDSTYAVHTTGIHYVDVTSKDGCTSRGSIDVTVNPLPAVNLGNNITLCTGQDTTLDAGNGFATYVWSTGTNTTTITVNSANTYSVTVTDTNGCSANDAVVVTVSICSGIEDGVLNPSSMFQVFPNPSDGNFEIRCQKSNVIIYNVLGEKVYQQEIQNPKFKIQNLKKGVYFLQVISEEGVWNERIIVN